VTQSISMSVRGLTVRRGARRVLDGVTFDLRAGSVLVLLGPNGAGKTTLLMAMAGLLRPERGSVAAGGREMAKATALERARIVSLLPQSLPGPVPFSVFETVLMGRYALSAPLLFESGRDREETERILRETGLWHLRGARCSELSGGELQRVLVASVIAQQAPVVLLDEPTASLDVGQRLRVADLIVSMASAGGRSVVVATHDLDLAASIADHVLLLRGDGGHRFAPRDEALREEPLGRLFGVPVHAHATPGGRTLFSCGGGAGAGEGAP